MHDIYGVAEIPERNRFPLGFELEQVIDIAQVGYMHHEVVCPGIVDVLVQLFRQAVEMQIGG
ncbi:MAG: hypothetical protein JW896_13300 [Deltaproteobacteria bacterium]|nr:hypothetical protein [Deltaproteobacteria bacterium]